VEHVEAGLVGGKPCAHLLHAAERTDRDPAVRLAAPWTSPVLETQQLLRGLVHERLDGVLIAQPVAAGDRVVRVLVDAVIGANDAGRAALCGHCVAPHRVHLGDHRDAQSRVGLGDGDGGAQTGAAAANEHYVMVKRHG
jgi:hypothetical protein